MTLKNSLTARLACLLIMIGGILVMAGCNGGSSASSTTTTTPAANNSVTVTAGSGPTGGYINGLFTTVTICAPGSTSSCQTVDNVLVDTGSVGLRILSSSFTTIQPSALGQIQDSTDDQLQECIQYGDTSYSWGPMYLANVQVGGETASNVAVQVIDNPSLFTVPASCLAMTVNPNLPNGGNENTVATFGANGILGVGPYPYDCGSACEANTIVATGESQSGWPYYICPTGQACAQAAVPYGAQAVNPVAFFSSSDNNGVAINLDSVPTAGAVSTAGTMYFGIGTQSDNALGSATIYALNDYEYIDTVTYGGIAYSYFNVFDTGSNALSVSDHSTLGIADCADNSFYCPSTTLNLSNIALTGDGGVGSGNVSLSIGNADSLLNSNPTFFAYNNLGADGGTSPATDLWDFGLPYFFGKTIFVGIAGTTVPGGASAPNGWYGL